MDRERKKMGPYKYVKIKEEENVAAASAAHTCMYCGHKQSFLCVLFSLFFSAF